MSPGELVYDGYASRSPKGAGDVALVEGADMAARFRLHVLEQAGKVHPGERIKARHPQGRVRAKDFEASVDFGLYGGGI
jgi:hypothetical protein